MYDAQIGLGMNPDQSMRGVFYGDEPGGGETKSLKIRDRNGAWHGEHDGRFESRDGDGAGGDARSSSAEEGTRNIAKPRSFDGKHSKWVGDEVPKESKAFQAGKAAMMDKMRIYTSLLMDQEAGVAVLVLNGREHEFVLGTSNSVIIPRPATGDYTTMHTHPRGSIFSSKDFWVFFRHSREVQMHVLTAKLTFSLYKPAEWENPDFSVEEIKDHIRLLREDTHARMKKMGGTVDIQEREIITFARLARSYYLNYRVGYVLED